MIERHWKGIVKPEQLENYITHLNDETFPKLAKMPGFIKASILQRPVLKGVEVLVVTAWDSMQSIHHFAGVNIATAVVPEKIRLWMAEYDKEVRHYDVLNESADQLTLGNEISGHSPS